MTVNGNLVFDGDVKLAYQMRLGKRSITEGTEDYVSINKTRRGHNFWWPKVIIATNKKVKRYRCISSRRRRYIEGNIYAGASAVIEGNLNAGTDRAVNSHIFRGPIDIDIPDNAINNFRIHENISEYLNIATTDGAEKIELGSTPKFIVLNNTNATDATTGAVQITGGLSAQQNIHSGIDVVADRDLVADRDVQIAGNNLTTSATTFNYLTQMLLQ